MLRVEYTRQEARTRAKNLAVSNVGVSGEQQSELSSTYRPSAMISASEAARHLSRLSGFMVIDELDAVTDEIARRKIAELIKQLSDAGSAFKLMLVGIGQTAADLTGAHPSLQRSLREARLPVMSDEKLREIVRKGADHLRLAFDDTVTTTIVRLSAGYPHFTHLLALKSAENAIRKRQKRIEQTDLPLAMTMAVEDAEGTLRDNYTRSVRSASPAYRELLTAAASLDGDEFTTADLRRAMPGGVNPAGPLRRLASNDTTTILQRTDRGIYRFTDQRMRSYIRIIHLMIDPIG